MRKGSPSGSPLLIPTRALSSAVSARPNYIWCWPVGSGEMYGYRTAADSSPAIKAAATPITNADNDIGQWNTFDVTVQGNTVTVMNNGKVVIPKITLPDLPAEGPLGLQHHGGPKGPDGKYTGIP